MAVKTLKGRPAWGGVVEGYAFVCPNSIQGWSSIDVNTGVVLEKGQIVDRGTQSELLSRCPLYQMLWVAHMGVRNWAVTSGEKEGN